MYGIWITFPMCKPLPQILPLSPCPSHLLPARGYFKGFPRRDRATFLPVLEKCLQPGSVVCSVVYSDDWGTYRNLERHLQHHVVQQHVAVHQDNFVDPATGVHTQEAEFTWAQLKSTIKERRGIAKEDLQ